MTLQVISYLRQWAITNAQIAILHRGGHKYLHGQLVFTIIGLERPHTIKDACQIKIIRICIV